MKYWEQKTAQLAYIMTDEMNSEGDGTPAQHMVMAMAWEMGYRCAVGGKAEEKATTFLNAILETEPYTKDILNELKSGQEG